MFCFSPNFSAMLIRFLILLLFCKLWCQMFFNWIWKKISFWRTTCTIRLVCYFSFLLLFSFYPDFTFILQQTLEAWSAVFIMAGSVLAADSIFFLIFGSGSEQSWNYKAEGESDEVESRMNNVNNTTIVTQENNQLP